MYFAKKVARFLTLVVTAALAQANVQINGLTGVLPLPQFDDPFQFPIPFPGTR